MSSVKKERSLKTEKKKIKLSSFANGMSGQQENPKKLTIQSYKKKKKRGILVKWLHIKIIN